MADKIKSLFEQRFYRWEISIPDEDMKLRRRGKIEKKGWTIWYLFGVGEEGEFLDYYASHRMTDDEHVRLHFSGKREVLPALVQIRLTSSDPIEDARLKEEYLAENKRIATLLEEKGFGLEGDESLSTQVNRYLILR